MSVERAVGRRWVWMRSWGGFGLVVCAMLAIAGQPADDPPASRSGPTTRPVPTTAATEGDPESTVSPPVGSAGTSAAQSALLDAQRVQMDLRLAELERIVSELARHIGGPTRDLTVRPDTSMDARMDRFERELRDLENRIARVERQFLDMERTINRIDRQR